MNRYRIIDIEHIKSRFKSEIAAQKAIDQLVYNPLVLSEEESLNKLKEVFYAGCEGFVKDNDGCEYPELTEQNWQEFKKTL